MHLHAGWENVGIVAALPANHDILFPKALRSPTRNPIARGTTESFHDVDGTPRRQCRPTERLRQIGRVSQTSAHLGVDLAGMRRDHGLGRSHACGHILDPCRPLCGLRVDDVVDHLLLVPEAQFRHQTQRLARICVAKYYVWSIRVHNICYAVHES